MRIFRIGDNRHPIWDGTGAAMVGGRWNSPGRPVIYGSLSYSCAMLEILAHANIGRIPKTHSYIVAEAPDDVSLEMHDPDSLPHSWDIENSVTARAFGDRWLQESRTAILVVPSVIARLDANALVNPNHPDAKKLIISLPERIIWDKRLFERQE
ncbi:RES domain-containing protein [Methylomicrobium sp. Wu6]|uniref:RES family NAD+ phosphorylase n=1 Tax=Methylomicrobium sp. Wu6 TaxID=3107928 RepID=UPI002DD62F6B|nr:RES domain-containing protein [Methylomicrobium sp. Wu6]MEC4746930.1 RES domain-containing protein [Methylomicrobium sp. Wu6]